MLLHRLLALLRRRPQDSDILHRQRVQFARLQEDLRAVIDGLQRGFLTLKDIDIMEE